MFFKLNMIQISTILLNFKFIILYNFLFLLGVLRHLILTFIYVLLFYYRGLCIVQLHKPFYTFNTVENVKMTH